MQMRYTLFGLVILGCLQQQINGQEDNFSIDVKQRNAEVYHEQSMKNNEFNYGYQVEKENSQFQHKAKGPDDVTYGCYGYIDPNNEKHLYYYVADRLGYRLVAPDQPTKIFSERVANSINKLNEDLKGKGNLDERVVAWNDLYLPDSCRRLNEILTIPTAAPVIRGFNGTSGGAVSVIVSNGGAPSNPGNQAPIATSTVRNVPLPIAAAVQTTVSPIPKPVVTANATAATIGNLTQANIPNVIPNPATIPKPIATATVTVGNSTYKAASASASIGNIPPVIVVQTTPYPIPKPIATASSRPPVTQAPYVAPNLPTIPIASTTPQGKVPPILSEPVRPPTIQFLSTTAAPVTAGYTYSVPQVNPNLDTFGPLNPHLGPFNGYVYPIHGGCPASEANIARLLTQMEALNDKVIELSANIRTLQSDPAAAATSTTCQGWLNRQDQFPLIVYVPILLPYVNTGEVPSKSSFNPASYAFQKMCKEECK